MNIFFDTSSLFKLYHEEEDTAKLLNFLNVHPDNKIFISQLTLVEMYSALLKKVRIGHLSSSDMKAFLVVLGIDLKKFPLVQIDSSLIAKAQELVIKYGLSGLHSLDAIQLASAISIKSLIDVAFTGDILLKRFFTEEGINCDF
ncbi:MAG TPA: type II toxin-antitoxin system VapC family toxin [Mucilaginibacter sp.]